jgi:hypothetical protein
LGAAHPGRSGAPRVDLAGAPDVSVGNRAPRQLDSRRQILTLHLCAWCSNARARSGSAVVTGIALALVIVLIALQQVCEPHPNVATCNFGKRPGDFGSPRQRSASRQPCRPKNRRPLTHLECGEWMLTPAGLILSLQTRNRLKTMMRGKRRKLPSAANLTLFRWGTEHARPGPPVPTESTPLATVLSTFVLLSLHQGPAASR